MAGKSKKIPLYKDADIGPEVRRLAYCFNLAAEIDGSVYATEKSIIDGGLKLFLATTDVKNPPALTSNEEAYMRVQFMRVAVKLQAGNLRGWVPAEEVILKSVDALMQAATKAGAVTKSDLL